MAAEPAEEVAEAQPDPEDPADAPETSEISRYHCLVLLILLLCNVMNQGHRQLLAVLLPTGMRCFPTTGNQTEADIGGNDDCIEMGVEEQGLLLGPAFAVPFVLGGIPLAQLSDKFRRTSTLTVSLVCWSTAVLCQVYLQMLPLLACLIIFVFSHFSSSLDVSLFFDTCPH
eukprot:m.87439 g.87439  ORF g.87439 m.87439 type:complete len:171 (+) comp11559_c0_seq1:262-774(+)